MTEPTATVHKTAEIQQFGSYHLVTFGNAEVGQYQVTIDNAGMIKLPQLVTPEEIPLLVGALEAAEPVAVKQQEDNHAAQMEMNEMFARQRAATEKKVERAHARHLKKANSEIASGTHRSNTPGHRRAAAERGTPPVRSKVAKPRNTGRVTRQPSEPLTPAPPRKAPPRQRAAAAETPAKKAPAKKAAPAKTATARKSPAKKAPAKTPTKKAAPKARKRSG